MPRTIWKGAISFGLVHVPVSLVSATSETGIDFDWLDKRSMDPVGYQRINKRTGKPIAPELREAMLTAGVVGIARVVMHTKEHLAALVPSGAALLLDTLRWPAELRALDDLKLPPEGAKAANLKDSELAMASQLIADMTEDWQPERYTDRFTAAVQALVDQRAEAGEIADVQPLEEGAAPVGSNVVDLTELLKRSLGARGGDRGGAPAAKALPKPATKAARPAAKAAAAKTAPRKRA